MMEEIKEEEREQAKEKDLPSFDDIDLSLLHPRERARLERSFEAQHMSHDQKERLSRITEVRFDEAMREYTGFGVGGAVEALVTVKHVKGLKAVMEFAHDSGVSYLFLGKGRNLLVRDGGMLGMVIRFGGEFCRCEMMRTSDEQAKVSVHAGVELKEFARFAEAFHLSGYERFVNLPGTVAGALQSGHSLRHLSLEHKVEEITVLNAQQKEITLQGKSLRFEGGKLKLPRTTPILRVLLKIAIQKSDEHHEERKLYPEGDVFSIAPFADPEKVEARQLIADAGLQGVRVGSARVSTLHPDFILNEGDATARDLLVLVGLVKDRVKQSSGVAFEQKIVVVGNDKQR